MTYKAHRTLTVALNEQSEIVPFYTSRKLQNTLWTK